MKLKYICLILIIFFLFMLSGCAFEKHGESLESFSQRMNEYNESYNMTSNGYIIDSSDSSFTKFFKFSEKEIMLKFRHDKKNRLTEMHIVFEKDILEESPNSYDFILNCIKSFCQNEDTVKDILNSIDFEKNIKVVKKETTSAESDNIKIEIDTTNLGTVVTIYKDI